jgi:hypothetical protein
MQLPDRFGDLFLGITFLRVEGHMPHADEGRNTDTGPHEHAVPVSPSKRVAEMSIRTEQSDRVPDAQEIEGSGMVSHLLDTQLELRLQIVPAGDGVGVRLRGDAGLTDNQVNELPRAEVHSLIFWGQGYFKDITHTLYPGNNVIKTWPPFPIKKPDIDKGEEGQTQEGIQPAGQNRVCGHVSLDHKDMSS